MAKRDTYRYELKHSKKIVSFGITDDPERREQEHKDDGKRFTKLRVVGPPVTRDTAEEWEEKKIDTYKKGHEGKPPRYNKQ